MRIQEYISILIKLVITKYFMPSGNVNTDGKTANNFAAGFYWWSSCFGDVGASGRKLETGYSGVRWLLTEPKANFFSVRCKNES